MIGWVAAHVEIGRVFCAGHARWLFVASIAVSLGACGNKPTQPASPRPAPLAEPGVARNDPVAPIDPEPIPGELETSGTTAASLPAVVRISLEDETAIEVVVTDAIRLNQTPGAVVALGRSDGLVFLRAYGAQQVEPVTQPMIEDAIFDLASVTKVFTAVAVMQLVERGQLALNEAVDAHLPELAGRGIRIEHLLTHTAGLASVSPLSDFEEREQAMHNALQHPSDAAPGKYQYSDLSFMALGELVSRVSGVSLSDYMNQHIIEPLQLRDTAFNPDAANMERFVPTEFARRRAEPGEPPPMIRGVPNDPRAWRLGGVAGHAGLFSTARDLAQFAQALLGSASLLGNETRAQMFQPRVLERLDGGGTARRGLGVEMSRWAPSSGASFGHGGYTGGWFWVDPEADAYVVILTNRVHPNGEGNAGPLRRRLLPVALPAIHRARAVPDAPVALGIDALRRDDFAPLAGKRVALFTNTSGRARDGKPTWQLLHDSPVVNLVALFAPEHGLDGDREGHIRHSTRGGLPVYSLFGANRNPPAESLDQVDLLVVDLQDVGVRFYTYAASVGRLLAAAAEREIRVLVLDRPNPIDGVHVEGPVTDDAFQSFVNHHPLPIRHGMTMGELAQFLVQEQHLNVDLEVVPLEGWQRGMRWDQTGLRWVPPSPNLRTPAQVLLYPAIGLLEAGDVSVGRGTNHPFEVVGAPWIRAATLLSEVQAQGLSGVAFESTQFRPRSSRHRGRNCQGIRLTVTNPSAFRPVRTGLGIARVLERHWPQWNLERAGRLIADQEVIDRIPDDATRLAPLWQRELEAFMPKRDRVLLYGQEGAAGPTSTTRDGTRRSPRTARP